MRHLLEKILLVSLLILFLILGWRAFTLNFNQPKVVWGVSFDPYYAAGLGLEPMAVYGEILNDLKVDHLRLSTYWNRIEKDRGVYDWYDLDWQLAAAAERQVQVILAVGRKLPRWPECYQPSWSDHLSQSEQEKELLEMIALTVRRYQGYDNIIAWQVENEPLVDWFGVCPAPDKNLLKKEIALVKTLDPRPVIITDSGELSTWLRTGGLGDILGTTMYRIVSNPTFGFWHWPLPPAYYYYKAALVKKITGVQKVIVTELQGEPWSQGALQNDSLTLQNKSMSPEQFQANLAYAQAAGFDTIYLWGAEWWYWLKTKQGIDDYWLTAKELWVK